MARKAVFTIPSLDEMEQTDQQEISVYATAKHVTKPSSASSAAAHTTCAPQIQTATSRSTPTLQSVAKEPNSVPSMTTKPPVTTCVKLAAAGDNTKSLGVRTVPIISGSNQSSRPTSGSVITSTADGTTQPMAGSGLSKTGKTNAVIVSTRQKGNPVLKYIRNVPWEFGDIVPDYQLGQTSCALYLSTRYHLLYPAYIHERLKQLGRSFDLRVVLMLIDVKDPHHALKEVTKMCILADCSLILAFSVEEAGRYLETYKSFEKKPPDLIMEKTEGNFLSQVTDVFTSARKINKTDAMTLLSTFGTVRGIVESSEDELSLCPGFGPQKAQRLHRLIHEPFIKTKKTKASQRTDEAGVHPVTSVTAGELQKQDKKQTQKV